MTNDPGTHGPTPDELADEVRRRLHAAVSDVRPSSDALDRLRAAVPARRRQRRVAILGAATLAALVLAGTPLLRTAVDADDGSESNLGRTNVTLTETSPVTMEPSSSVGGVSAGVPGTVDSAEPSPPGEVLPVVTTSSAPPPTVEPSAPPEQTVTPPLSASSSPPPTPTTPAPVPTKPPPVSPCQATDLFGEDAHLGTVGADGLAYGVLQVRSNASRDCAVAGPGAVVVVSPPGNPIVQVSVVEHVDGDVATQLPEPASSVGGITLKKGQAYEFQFAWQPQAPGADGTCGVDAPPAPVPALGYTLVSGDFNVANVTLTSTCGGTLYRTDIYRTGEHPRVK